MHTFRSTRKIISGVSILTFCVVIAALAADAGDEPEKLAISHRFHRETSHTWRGVIMGVFRSNPKKPPQYKSYPDSKKTALPKPTHRGISVEEAITTRRSQRNYSRQAMSMEQLSQLLFAAQGVTGKTYGQPLRSVPSAGALYPFEIYAVIHNVQGLAQGLYHYSVLDHALELVEAGDFRSRITKAGLDQDMLGEANVVFVLSAIFDRTRHKYGERGGRYVYIEAGHISQNIYLQSVSLGLGSVSIGAFIDEKINQLIGVDGRDEAVIYMHPVGTI